MSRGRERGRARHRYRTLSFSDLYRVLVSTTAAAVAARSIQTALIEQGC